MSILVIFIQYSTGNEQEQIDRAKNKIKSLHIGKEEVKLSLSADC